MYEMIARAMAHGVKWVSQMPNSEKKALADWLRGKLKAEGIYSPSDIEQAIQDALDSKLADVLHAVL